MPVDWIEIILQHLGAMRFTQALPGERSCFRERTAKSLDYLKSTLRIDIYGRQIWGFVGRE